MWKVSSYSIFVLINSLWRSISCESLKDFSLSLSLSLSNKMFDFAMKLHASGVENARCSINSNKCILLLTSCLFPPNSLQFFLLLLFSCSSSVINHCFSCSENTFLLLRDCMPLADIFYYRKIVGGVYSRCEREIITMSSAIE